MTAWLHALPWAGVIVMVVGVPLAIMVANGATALLEAAARWVSPDTDLGGWDE